MRNGAAHTVLLIVAIVILFVGGLFFLSQQNATVAPEKDAITAQPSQPAGEQPQTSGSGLIEGDDSGPNMQGIDVTIEDYAFEPVTLTVKKGAKVTWKNDDSVQHTVTATDGSFDSGLLSKDQTFSHTFNEAGTFDYFCKPHPTMKAKIIVQ